MKFCEKGYSNILTCLVLYNILLYNEEPNVIGIVVTSSYLKVSEEAQTARGSDPFRLELVQ